MSNAKLLVEKQGIKLKKLASLLLTAEDVGSIADITNYNVFDNPISNIFSVLYTQGFLDREEGKNAVDAINGLVSLLGVRGYKFPIYHRYLESAANSPPPEPDPSAGPNPAALSTPIRVLRQRIEQEIQKPRGGGIDVIPKQSYLDKVKLIENALASLNYEKAGKDPHRDTQEKSKRLDALYDKLSAGINADTKAAAGLQKIEVSTVATDFSSPRVPIGGGFGKSTIVQMEPDMLAVPSKHVEALRELSHKYSSSNGVKDTFQNIGPARVSDIIPPPDASRQQIRVPVEGELLESVAFKLKEHESWNAFTSKINLSWTPKPREGEENPPSYQYASVGLAVPGSLHDMVAYRPGKEEDKQVYLLFRLTDGALLKDPSRSDTVLKPVGSLIATVRSFLAEARSIADDVGVPQSLEAYSYYYDLNNYLDDLSLLRKSADRKGYVSIVRVPWSLEEAEKDGLPLASVSQKETDSILSHAIISPVTDTQFAGFVDFDQDYRMMILWAHVESGQVGTEGKSYVQHTIDILRRNRPALTKIMGGNPPLVQRTKGGARYAFEEAFSLRAVAARRSELVDFINKLNGELNDTATATRIVREPPSSLSDEDFGFMHGN